MVKHVKSAAFYVKKQHNGAKLVNLHKSIQLSTIKFPIVWCLANSDFTVYTMIFVVLVLFAVKKKINK